jgi:hypothetical protein
MNKNHFQLNCPRKTLPAIFQTVRHFDPHLGGLLNGHCDFFLATASANIINNIQATEGDPVPCNPDHPAIIEEDAIMIMATSQQLLMRTLTTLSSLTLIVLDYR